MIEFLREDLLALQQLLMDVSPLKECRDVRADITSTYIFLLQSWTNDTKASTTLGVAKQKRKRSTPLLRREWESVL